MYNEFSSYRLFAGGDHAAARLYAGLAEAAKRRLARLLLTSTNDLRGSEYRLSRQNISQRLPGSVFDARMTVWRSTPLVLMQPSAAGSTCISYQG